jgi:hypothetical protein
LYIIVEYEQNMKHSTRKNKTLKKKGVKRRNKTNYRSRGGMVRVGALLKQAVRGLGKQNLPRGLGKQNLPRGISTSTQFLTKTTSTGAGGLYPIVTPTSKLSLLGEIPPQSSPERGITTEPESVSEPSIPTDNNTHSDLYESIKNGSMTKAEFEKMMNELTPPATNHINPEMSEDKIREINETNFDAIYKKTTTLLLSALPGLISIKTFSIFTPLLLFNAAYYQPLSKFVASFSEQLIQYKSDRTFNFKKPLEDSYTEFKTMTSNDHIAFVIGSLIITQIVCNFTLNKVPDYCIDFKTKMIQLFDNIKKSDDLIELRSLYSQDVLGLIDSLPDNY